MDDELKNKSCINLNGKLTISFIQIIIYFKDLINKLNK